MKNILWLLARGKPAVTLKVLPYILTAENIQGTRGVEHEHQYLSSFWSEKSCWSLEGERTAVNVDCRFTDRGGETATCRVLHAGGGEGAGENPAWKWDPGLDKILPASLPPQNCKTWHSSGGFLKSLKRMVWYFGGSFFLL